MILSLSRQSFRLCVTSRLWLRTFAASSSQRTSRNGFEAPGMPHGLVKALQTALPHVTKPLPAQSFLIEHVLRNENILLRDRTGRGKSLALLFALLSLPRLATAPDATFSDPTKAQAPRSLLLVPHAGLATQYLSWIHLLFPHADPTSLNPHRLGSSPFPDLVQVLIRPPPDLPSAPSLAKISKHLTENPPHLLISTPGRLNDLLLADPNPRPLHRLLAFTPTVALDEVDALISLPPRDATDKQWKKWEAHIPPAIEVIERMRLAKDELLSHGERKRYPMARAENLNYVMTSATAGAKLRDWLEKKSEWLEGSKHLVIKDFGRTEIPEGTAMGNPEMRHCAVVYDKLGSLRNFQPLDIDTKEIASGDSKRPGSAADPALVEAIATVFALTMPPPRETSASTSDTVVALSDLPLSKKPADRPPVRALLLLPPNMSTPQVSAALTDLQVPVIDLSSSQAPPTLPEDETVLFVATSTFARGLDIPALTHVFLGFLPGDGGDYLHFAGRVGRLGGLGKGVGEAGVGTVVTFLSGDGTKAEGGFGELMEQLGVAVEPLEEVEE